MYNILNFGACLDGITLSTNAIQRAIDFCSKNGGGKVIIPKGTFITGSIYLKNNVELHLEKGAVLKASTNLNDYNDEEAYPQNWCSKSEQWTGKHLLMALECENVSLTGQGVIDGSGEFFFEEPKRYPFYPWMGYTFPNGFARAKDKVNLRPGQMICFIECENVCISGITAQNSTCWTILLHGCENVKIEDVKIFNPDTAGNTDGIDVDCCRNVDISNCKIDTGDDALTLRCSSARLKKYRPCENITVSNCELASSACGVRVGVGTGEIKHANISNISIKRSGFAINYITSYAGYGKAEIQDVNFSNVNMDNVAFPLQIEGDVGFVKNVNIENVDANALCGINLKAVNECKVSNILLKNFKLAIIPDKRPLDQQLLRLRGNTLVNLLGVDSATLSCVNVNITDDQLTTWENVLKKENCDKIDFDNCSFPQKN